METTVKKKKKDRKIQSNRKRIEQKKRNKENDRKKEGTNVRKTIVYCKQQKTIVKRIKITEKERETKHKNKIQIRNS